MERSRLKIPQDQSVACEVEKRPGLMIGVAQTCSNFRHQMTLRNRALYVTNELHQIPCRVIHANKPGAHLIIVLSYLLLKRTQPRPGPLDVLVNMRSSMM